MNVRFNKIYETNLKEEKNFLAIEPKVKNVGQFLALVIH